MKIIKNYLLDCLIDEMSDQLYEIPETHHVYDRFHRDLENLLNTRCSGLLEGKNKILENSILNYGLPDVFNAPPRGNDAADLMQQLQEIIQHFEPRLQEATLTLLPCEVLEEGLLRFRITGWLSMCPEPALLTLDSTFNPATQFFQLKYLRTF